MKLGVIAAGEGERLKYEGIDIPKPLISVSGKTLLERIFIITEKYGFESCNIIINEKFRKDVEDSGIFNKYPYIEINCIYKSTPSSLHSLNELKELLGDSDFCLMTIDSIFRDSEFGAFVNMAKEEKDSGGLIAVTDYVDDEKPLWVRVGDDNKIMEFSSGKNNTGFITGGIYFFRKGVIGLTDSALSKNMNRLRNFLQYIIESGIKLKAVQFGKIIDLDHKSDLEEAERFLQEQ